MVQDIYHLYSFPLLFSLPRLQDRWEALVHIVHVYVDIVASK